MVEEMTNVVIGHRRLKIICSYTVCDVNRQWSFDNSSDYKKATTLGADVVLDVRGMSKSPHSSGRIGI